MRVNSSVRTTIIVVCTILATLVLSPVEGIGRAARAEYDRPLIAWGLHVTIEQDQLEGLSAVDAGDSHVLGIRDGRVVAWGYNEFGQCIPPVNNMEPVAVSAGVTHSLALQPNGSIVCWGYADCTIPEPNTDFTAIDGGWLYSLGLKQDGRIVAWGSNESGQCNVPSLNADFVAMAAGGFHALGLKSAGDIVAWGRNFEHECDIGALRR